MILREPPSRASRFTLTGSFDGFLSSVPWKPEGLGQVQGSVVQRQPMDGSPEIERAALHAAILLEASKSILAQMDRKGPFLIRTVAVHRTAPATLRTAAAHITQQIQKENPVSELSIAFSGFSVMFIVPSWATDRARPHMCSPFAPSIGATTGYASPATMATEEAKEDAIVEFADAGNLQDAKRAPARLERSRSFTDFQIDDIAEACLSNDQVYRIAEDEEVQSFVRNVILPRSSFIDPDTFGRFIPAQER